MKDSTAKTHLKLAVALTAEQQGQDRVDVCKALGRKLRLLSNKEKRKALLP